MRGIYCLANDAVLPWFHALLHSVRRYHPTLPVYVIPFDHQTSAISALTKRFHFTLLPEDPMLAALDELGRRHYPADEIAAHAYRKFYAFWGPLSIFCFFDADIVILDDLTTCFDAFEHSGCQLLSFAHDLDYVYRPGNFREMMRRDYQAIGINTGHFISLREVLSFEGVTRYATDVLPHLAEFAPTYEQPFLNYCLARAQVKTMTSEQLLPQIGNIWAGLSNVLSASYLTGHTPIPSDDTGKWVPFLHWAGCHNLTYMPYQDVFVKHAPLRYRLRVKTARLKHALKMRLKRFRMIP